MSRRHPNTLRQRTLPALLLAGDAVCVFGGMLIGYALRYHTAFGSFFIDVINPKLADYLPLLLLGTVFLLAAFVHLNLYDDRLLLRRYLAFNLIFKGAAFWFAAYLGLSLVLKFDPPISRLFMVFAWCGVFSLLYLWRNLFYLLISSGPLREKIQQRTVILGWNAEVDALVAEISPLPSHPLRLIGTVALPASTHSQPPFAPNLPALGDFGQLAAIFETHRVDVLIAARLDMPTRDIARLVEQCERSYVDLKVVPSMFQIFFSGLRLQTYGRIPVLGIEELAIEKLLNRIAKRFVDVVGAMIGLIIFSPVIAVLAVLIKRESPNGPVFFSQSRIGTNHCPFTLYKLRSMGPDAAAHDHLHQSTARDDQRLLRVGRFIRRWNLDETPQFWNVLRGEMSLVGPRPERPVHVERLSDEIPHYLPRHVVKPGMTGWAQINGLRGEGALAQRIQHDIYYIENWSPWLDAQILLLTLVRWRNPSAY
ncbi:MAG TPA: sugar transferase [Lacunisphaera sp.]|jgi:exopolysaccharide biosynthesis polyprenyl glycosylphosphotransferase